MPFGLSGVSSSRSVVTSRSNASRPDRFGLSLFSGMFVCLRLTTPAQFVAQDVEVVSITRLNEVERRAALPNYDPVRNLESKTNLPVERQRHVFVVCLQ